MYRKLASARQKSYFITAKKQLDKTLLEFAVKVKKQSVLTQKKTAQLKVKIDKTMTQLKQCNKVLHRPSVTQISKKKLLVNKKASAEMTKLLVALKGQVDIMKREQDQLGVEYNQLIALRKYLSQFPKHNEKKRSIIIKTRKAEVKPVLKKHKKLVKRSSMKSLIKLKKPLAVDNLSERPLESELVS